MFFDNFCQCLLGSGPGASRSPRNLDPGALFKISTASTADRFESILMIFHTFLSIFEARTYKVREMDTKERQRVKRGSLEDVGGPPKCGQKCDQNAS